MVRQLLIGLCLVPTVAAAQTGGPGSRLAWDQPAGSLAQAQGYVYEASWNGSPIQPVTSVTCTGAASPYVCAGAIPALVPGPHRVQLRAVDTATVPGTRLESPLSALFNFTLVALPGAPTNLRIVVTPPEDQ